MADPRDLHRLVCGQHKNRAIYAPWTHYAPQRQACKHVERERVHRQSVSAATSPVINFAMPPSLEESADTDHDHIHRGQEKSENGPQLALELVFRGVWHCVAQHLENAAQRSAKLPGRPILRPVGGHHMIYLGLSVHGH